MEHFLKDLKHSIRTFHQNPGFTLPAIAALTLGIGANTAIFSVINAVLLKPLTYPNPERMVRFTANSPEGQYDAASVTNYALYSRQTSAFEDIAAYDFGGPGLNLTTGAFPEQIQGIRVTEDYFHLFGAVPVLGRTFTSEEDQPNGGHVVVLSYGFWRRRFGGDPQIVGKAIPLSGDLYTVVGVIGPDFTFDPPPDIWLPFQFDLNSNDQAHYFFVAARLRPGVTIDRANAQLRAATVEFRHKYPGANAQWWFAAVPFRDTVIGDIRSSLWVLLAAVTLVLLIACANVANLLLVRATGRKREIAIRAAVGAGRTRIIRQLLAESVLLSFASGVCGLVLGIVGVRALLALYPGNIPRIGENGTAVTLDLRVLLFTMAVAFFVGIVFGLFPALAASRADLSSTLKESGGRSGSSVRQNKARSLLVVVEMALALVLLIGAALLIRTFIALRNVDAGFSPHRVLTMQMSLTGARFEKASSVAQLVHDGVEQLQALPGVEFAATTCCLPLEGGYGLGFTVVGRPPNGKLTNAGGGWMSIGPNYFDVFNIRLLRGRKFNDRDDTAGARVVIINQGLARQLWLKSDPLKDRILIGHGVGPEFEEPPRQIVGVVADVHNGGLNREPPPMMYIPVSQVTDGITALNNKIAPIMWIIRTRGEPRSLGNSVQEVLRKASGGLPVAHVRTMDEVVIHSTARADFNMLLLTIFGACALLLAAIGVYGLMTYSVEQRTTEIGVRMALGAEASQVRNLVIIQGMRLVIAGMVLGLAAAFGLTRLLATFLFGVHALDPSTFLLMPLFLGAIALLAVWLPARRATCINPISALKYE